MSKEYDWPGNVRELRAFTRELAIKSPIPILDSASVREALGSQDLNSFDSSCLGVSEDVFKIDFEETFDHNVSRFEKFLLEQSLGKYNTKLSREKLGMSRSRFYEKLKFYGILQK